MTFTLDTSGVVHFATRYAKAHGLLTFYQWEDLPSDFVRGYTRALFAELCARPVMEAMGFSAAQKRQAFGLIDPEPAAMEQEEVHALRMRSRAWREPAFSDLAPETLARIIADCAGCSPNTSQAGAQLWRNRQEGAYFNLPPQTPYLGGDGRVYVRERV